MFMYVMPYTFVEHIVYRINSLPDCLAVPAEGEGGWTTAVARYSACQHKCPFFNTS